MAGLLEVVARGRQARTEAVHGAGWGKGDTGDSCFAVVCGFLLLLVIFVLFNHVFNAFCSCF